METIFDNMENYIVNLLGKTTKYIFHGKRTDTGDWVEGHYFTKVYSAGTNEDSWAHIIKEFKTGIEYEVHPNTVSIYLGFDDKRGNKIFLHDVVMYNSISKRSAVIFYDARRLSLRFYDGFWPNSQDIELLKTCTNLHRLGSIHDLTEEQLELAKLGKKNFVDLF